MSFVNWSSFRYKWRLFVCYLSTFLLICGALGAWIYASPKGADPDGSFHLVSIWCGSGYRVGKCEIVNTYRGLKLDGVAYVPSAIARDYGNLDTATLNIKMLFNHKNNFSNLYPKGYYWFSSKFVQSNIERTVLILRWINVSLFAVCILSAHYFLPKNMRKGFGLTILVLLMPLGIFTVASNNPSSWAITSLGTYWAFLFVFLSQKGTFLRTLLVSFFCLFSALIGLVSRGDSCGYLVLSTIAVIAIVHARKSSLVRVTNQRLWLPAVVVLASFYLFSNASQNDTVLGGFIAANGMPGREVATSISFSVNEFIYNLTKVPGTFAGFFGLEGTNGFLGGHMAFSMPEIVSLGMLFLLSATLANSNSMRSKSEVITITLFAIAVISLPILVMFRTGQLLPGLVQSRYMLPIAIPLVGLFVSGSDIESKIVTSKMFKYQAASVLALSYLIALHVSLRNYVLPLDSIGLNLNQSRMWWRQGVPSPMVILFLGTLSYVTLVYVFVHGNKKPAMFKVVAGKNR